jgi:hypothetical protein
LPAAEAPPIKFAFSSSLETFTSPRSKNENQNFLKGISNKMNNLEKYVILQLDEIYINSSLHYRGGKLFGIPENKNSNAGS